MAANRKKKSEMDMLMHALNHPLRRDILKLMLSRDQLSPVQAARITEQPLSNVSYHVRVLDEAGAVELVETLPRRGAVEHVYSTTDKFKAAVADWL